MFSPVKLPGMPKSAMRMDVWGPLAIILCAWLAGQGDFLQGLEWRSLDWRTHLRTSFQPPADERLAVVLFDDGTEEQLGQAWPVDRVYHAELIRLLALSGARTVALDVILDASREGVGDATMGAIAQAAVLSGTQVISAAVTNPEPTGAAAGAEGPTKALRQVEGDIRQLLGDEHAFIPFPELRAVSWYGFADTPADAGGIRREIPLLVRVGDAVFPTLSLQTLLVYHGVAPDDVRVRLGDAVYFPVEGRTVRMPVTKEGRFLLNYRYDTLDGVEHLPTYAYGSVLIGLGQAHGGHASGGNPPPPDFKGKIVFIGQTVSGKADMGPTQLAHYSPLVYVHANLVSNVLAGDFARRVPGAVAWALVVALGMVGSLVSRRGTPGQLGLFAVIAVAGYIAVACGLWIWASLWLALTMPATAILLVQFFHVVRRVRQEQRAKEHIRGMFNSYLSPALLDRMMAKGGLTVVGSERKAVTILFSDLRDFTSWSESTPEDVLIAQLNEYLAAMVECIHAHGGTLHKFIGDAVMAVWGDLVSEGEAADAEKACQAALAMQQRLAELNEAWAGRGLHTLRMGIGLNHGVVLAGNIGSPRRMEFTVIGDAVNLASRLEALNKELRTQILVGQSVMELAAGKFVFRPIGNMSIKGKSKGVNINELMGKQAT